MLFNIRLYTDDSGLRQVFIDNFATVATKSREEVPVSASAVGFTKYMDDFSQPNAFFYPQ